MICVWCGSSCRTERGPSESAHKTGSATIFAIHSCLCCCIAFSSLSLSLASCRCLERLGRRWQEHGEWPAVDASTSCLLLEDFESGLYKIGASAMRGITLEVPKVKWILKRRSDKNLLKPIECRVHKDCATTQNTLPGDAAWEAIFSISKMDWATVHLQE